MTLWGLWVKRRIARFERAHAAQVGAEEGPRGGTEGEQAEEPDAGVEVAVETGWDGSVQ